MGSPLDFASSESFRKKLMARNLAAYSKSPYKPTPPLNYEAQIGDQSVIDSPDSLIDEPSFANKLYPLNQYGSEGGYKQVPDPNALLNTKSNEGEYGFQDAMIVDQSTAEQKKWKPLNLYSNGSEIQLDAAEFVNSLEIIERRTLTNNQPYPTTFVASFYAPVNILLSQNPSGSNGLMSQDSYLAQLGGKLLKKEFEERIGREILQRTVGRANILNATSGVDYLNIAAGIVPVLEPNWTITEPANPLIAATDLALRLAGSTIPVSTIPGSYFDPSINPGQPTTIQQIQNAFRQSFSGNFFNKLVGPTQSGSQLFLNNTGGGQKSRLFFNIDYNKYKPGYTRSTIERLAGALVGTTSDNSNYYIGSVTSEPSRIFSPSGDLPNNSFGQEIQTPVYGPDELAKLYEGPERDYRFGTTGPIYSDGGGIEGGFTWTSSEYKGNAGKKVGISGEIVDEDENFSPSSYNQTESTNNTYKEGSILDDTQRLIDSQPQGAKRYSHVGNAIDQVSKIFNDGYREITKGSRVLRYIGDIGQERGTEYCRIFTKDVPYLRYNNLQQTDGMTTEGRKFSYSVMDKTYNLNMYPVKREGGQDSTNLVANNTTGNEIYAKKYMLSLENLAWRTSNKPGYTINDLPYCERGPNGGRVMWFPPYGLTFSESVRASWKSTELIGRPEPIFTYSNTSRSGSLSFKIVVDHPSVLNLIVNKILGNESNKAKVNSVLESFFAGCRKYDLYELAKKYYTVNPNDLFEIQKQLDEKKESQETITQVQQTLTTGNESNNSAMPIAPQEQNNNLESFVGLGFYFDNNQPPELGTVSPYTSYYDAYQSNKSTYLNKSTDKVATEQFFTNVIDKNFKELQNLCIKIKELFVDAGEGSTITIDLESTTSRPATQAFNSDLSKRRTESVEKWFQSAFGKLIDEKKVIIEKKSLGETASVTPKRYNQNSKIFEYGEPATCKDSDSRPAESNEIYTINDMSCRRVSVTNIRNNIVPKKAPKNDPGVVVGNETKGVENKSPQNTVNNTQTDLLVRRPNITKRVLRSLLTECDYFEAIKEDTPMVFDNLKEKLKFFHPTFHSTTPEGLNSRLTFLQQCMRPGDTIPVVKSNGEREELVYNHAINTAFGAPPVLVLRIGDFYHTKIIPDNLQITYDNQGISLDMNSEGIGIQPMIANITLTFNFVGGQGLKEAVDKLQNALSFNFYANTEMYDDRADATDESYKILDDQFLKDLNLQSPPPSLENLNPQSNSSPIGTIIETTKTENSETGKIQYTDFMNRVSKETQSYFKDVLNKNRQVLKQYNNSIRQLWVLERNYFEGAMPRYGPGSGPVDNSNNTPILGKPVNYQQRITKIIKDLVNDIDDNNEPFMIYMTDKKRNFSKKVIRTLRNNYKTYVNEKKNTFLSSLTQTIQQVTNQQQNFVMTLTRVNIILDKDIPTGQGSDGYEQKNGFVTIILTSGDTTTVDDLKADSKKISESIQQFLTISETEYSFKDGNSNYTSKLLYKNMSENTIFVPLSKKESFNSREFQRQYTILNQEVVDGAKYTEFKNKLIGSILKDQNLFEGLNTELEKEFDFYWKQIAGIDYQDENRLGEQFISELEKNPLKDFINFTPYPDRKRVLSYIIDDPANSVSDREERVAYIKSLGATNNSNTNKKTWNDFKNEIFPPKVKFN